MKKAMKKIIVAGVALVAALGLATGTTFAWFSMNNQSNVTGMTISTEVSSNLFIATDSLSSTQKAAESAFGTNLSQTVNGKLEPVSTTDGKTFFYTTNAKANGDAQEDDYTAYTNGTTSYSGSGFVGYVDYVFQLKAVNVATSGSQAINLTQLELKHNNAADISTVKAFRVALFVETISSAPAGGVGTLTSVYAKSGSANFSDAEGHNYAISAANTAPTAMDVDYNKTNCGVIVSSVPNNTTTYYKVVVRLYLEGEDTSCNNATFLPLNTTSWALTLKLEFNTGTAVTDLTTSVTA